MQKKSYFIIFFIFFMVIPCSARSNYIDFGVSLSSGFNVHTNGDLAKDNILYTDSSAAKILIGTSADVAFHLTEPVHIFAGADVFADFIFKDALYYHTIDYALYSGIKIFPGFNGLSFSIAYAFGNRTDFVNIVDEENTLKGSCMAKWGNGFRLSLEYDFLYDTDAALCPMVGFYYRCMPRGNNNYDNIFAAYVGLRF